MHGTSGRARELNLTSSNREHRLQCKQRWLLANDSEERLPFADSDGAFGRDLVPSAALQPFLLAGGGHLGTLGSVASGASGGKVLHAGGSALGPWAEMLAVLSGP